MKKFLIICTGLVLVLFLVQYVSFNTNIFINVSSNQPVTTFTKVTEDKILLDQGMGYTEFEIKGVNMGVGIPGHYATEYAITKEDYLRWFKYIQEMGANAIRVYTILHDDFYDAFYEYNIQNETPLYLIHGLWVDDYIQNSSRDALDSKFEEKFVKDAKILVDVIHGRQRLLEGREYGGGTYDKDISQWVLGYILGVEWEDATVAYTNEMNPEYEPYEGKYMYTDEDASAFETMLARVGDQIIEYESDKYKNQRLVAFSNWPTTDPFEYPDQIAHQFRKITKVDVEHIKTTEAFISGTFASYHVYPYYPDYLNYEDDVSRFTDERGQINTYREYLRRLNTYHTMPVVISEFGFPSSRGMAQKDKNRGYNQGFLSEKEQGEAIVRCYEDIKAAGSAGAIIFTWQDEWFKRTWNTMHAVDLNHTPYWSDYQTNEQYFGLLSFDPGKERSVSYIDGDREEWKQEDVVLTSLDSQISMKYDEKYLYFLIYKKGYQEDQTLYLPLDITPKTGSMSYNDENITFERPTDFIIKIQGKEESRILVQDRYDVLRAMYYHETHNEDPYENPPELNSSQFNPIELILQTPIELEYMKGASKSEGDLGFAETYETGKLLHGNANPQAEDFNSLADFNINGEYIELKIPWQLLNFSNPSKMKIHDDYYENYGVEEIKIHEIYVGLGDEDTEGNIKMETFRLKGWGRDITYHERLKASYYIVQEVWNSSNRGQEDD